MSRSNLDSNTPSPTISLALEIIFTDGMKCFSLPIDCTSAMNSSNLESDKHNRASLKMSRARFSHVSGLSDWIAPCEHAESISFTRLSALAIECVKYCAELSSNK
eukprot:34117_1